MSNLVSTISTVRSGVFHIVFLDQAEKRIGSGTAFLSSRHVITNGHVFDYPQGTKHVWIRREEDLSPSSGVFLSAADFTRRRVVASPKDECDYAVLDIPELLRFKPFSFKLSGHDGVMAGMDVAFLGFPFDQTNLVCHKGIVSSIWRQGAVDTIQIDASVNPGNSGGPLFDVGTGRVIGIVTRKQTGLLKDLFKQLRAAINENLRVAELRAGVKISDLGLDKILSVGQNQVMMLLDQVERSANVGIGYAFSCSHLLEDPSWQPA